jgi:hypothetical protein
MAVVKYIELNFFPIIAVSTAQSLINTFLPHFLHLVTHLHVLEILVDIYSGLCTHYTSFHSLDIL